MQLEDIKEESNKFLKKAQKEQEQEKTETASRNDLLVVDSGLGVTGPKSDQRRGSHLLAAAGIDLERRRQRPSHTGTPGEGRIFLDGDQWMEERDGKITKLEIIEVKEKMGNMRKSVPTLPVPLAILLCLLNVILPGIGTFIGASTLLCCGKCRHDKPSTGIKYGILAGFFQVILTPLLVGWIFSIYYGCNIIQDSISRAAYKKDESNSNLGDGVLEVEKPNRKLPTLEGSKNQA